MSAPAKLPRWADLVLLPLVNLTAALGLAGLVVALLGESPWVAGRLMLTGSIGSQDGLGYTLYYATGFIFTGLAVSVAYHAGLFNIGAEGQAYIGGLGTGLVALWLGDASPWLVLPLSLLAGALFGAAWAFLPAWLQARRGSHIVITTIMFNFLASALMPSGVPSPKPTLPVAATPLNAAFLFALAAAALVWALIWRTRWGYALRVVGQNESAAVYAGITPSRVVIGAMLLSGALAGCFGLNELLGAQHRILIDFPGGAGFVGIAVALMGRNHPAGIMGAAVLFGALYQGGSQLSFDLPKLNRDMVVVIQGLVILFCGALENVFRAPLARLLAIFQRGEGGR